MPELLNISELTGLWTRSLLVQPDGRRDKTTAVSWLQGPSLYIDLRQPPGRPDFSHARGLAELTAADCAWLATQQGFAGVLRQDGEYFEWVRELDLQPPAGPDAGKLFWQDGILVETGRYAEYLEHWHRDPAWPRLPCGAARLRAPEDGRQAMLVRAGAEFMVAYGRRPAQKLAGATLAEAVAGAATLREAQALLDCEVSYGHITADIWRITRSSLPFREGANLTVTQPSGTALCLGGTSWQILVLEGNLELHR